MDTSSMIDFPSSSRLDLLRLNISGRRYEIRRSTAEQYEQSVFGLLAATSVEGKEKKLREKGIYLRSNDTCSCFEQEWYAERSISAFELILDYLCNGRLHCPANVCKEVLKRELAFWRLDRVPLSDCCWDDEDEDHEVKQQAKVPQLSWRMKDFLANEMRAPPETSKITKYLRKIRITLKSIVSNSSTSKAAMVFNIVSVFFIALAVINLVVSTMPAFQTCDDTPDDNETSLNITIKSNTSTNVTIKKRFWDLKFTKSCDSNIIFEIIELICVIWFTFEWILRFSLSSNKCKFLRSPLNIVDLLSIIPYYVDVLIWVADVESSSESLQTILTLMRVFRAFRLFNIVRLARYSESLKLMGITLWSSRREFGVLVIFIMFTVTIFSTILFFCERDLEDTEFTSIPATFWWAIVTVTTVGYGDMVPKTTAGKILSSMCCVGGIIVVAFPVSILVEHFHRLYRTRAKKSPPHRIAIWTSQNEMGVIQTRRLTNFENQVQITKL